MEKVNFHIIFSNELKPDVIEAHFLKAIQHKLKVDAECGDDDFNEIITPKTLEELGKKIKQNTTKEIKDSDLKTGFNSLAFNFDVVFEKLSAGTFKDKYLTAVGKSEWDTMRWDGSPGVKRNVINKADFVFTALEKPDTYKNKKDKLTEQKVNDKLLDCSDAHKFSSDEKPERRLGNCFTWLKANTTFEGLKQVAKEVTRIHVGNLPLLLQRVKDNPTRYIKKLSFNKLTDSRLEEIWFENLEVDINSGLVAIIGNKGNGKSALSDSIGLVGNTPNCNDFSFLEKNKFRAPRPNRSENFDAILTWETNLNDTQNLSKDPHPAAVENVKYLPQGFLEVLCNESHINFEEELRNVIFTHIPENERFDKTSLKDLEKFHTDSIQNEIHQILIDLKEVNQVTSELERKESDGYKEQLISNLAQKNLEYEAHKQNKPAIVEQPTDEKTLEKNKEVATNIENKRKELAEIDVLSSQNLAKQKLDLALKVGLTNVLSALKILQTNYDKTVKEISPVLASNDIKIQDVITFEIKSTLIDNRIADLDSELDTINKLFDKSLPDSLPNKSERLIQELTSLQNVLDEPSKNYQKYLDELTKWNNTENELVGNADSFGTIKYFENEISYVENQLEKDLSEVFILRQQVLNNLFAKKLEILNILKSFYKPITDFISAHKDILETYEIQLDIENKMSNFEDKFLSQINAGARGSFMGIEEGRKRLSDILFINEWQTSEGITSLLNTIIEHLKKDKRWNDEERDVEKQLKSGYTVTALYDFLFGLEYLEPSYKLKLNGKNISELSPGERGALLLIFYLALDKNDIPLVIDQPEENLDNQSVFTLLAQFIKKAKEKRQVIIVTHNPNLAVVCDADQIIHVKIEKQNKNKVIINSGALENPIINKTVVDILEGTYEAFDTREIKYKVIPR